MDDTYTIIKRAQLQPFTAHINSIHPRIQFTIEEEQNGVLPMLDVKIHRNEGGSLYFPVYCIATHTDQYLAFDSCQPLQHKLGVIRTLKHRAETIVTRKEDLEAEIDHIKKALSISGYPEWTWNQANTTSRPAQKERNPDAPTKKGSVTLPYIPGLTEKLCRYMRKKGIQCHVKPHTKLRNLLVHPKDPTPPEDRCSLVYLLECGDCDAKYVGETQRKLGVRAKEHQRQGPVSDHLKEKGHSLDPASAKVLDREGDWYKRGVKEACHIFQQQSDLNQDAGRHLLPRGYRSLLTKSS